MSAADLGALGIPTGALGPRASPLLVAPTAVIASSLRVAPSAADRRSEAALALAMLAAALAGIYAVNAVPAFTRSASMGALLSGAAVLQLAWLCGTRKWRSVALTVGIAVNALLVAVWLLSRTRGLPAGTSGAQPVALLDTLCAIDSAAVGVLAWALRRRSAHRLSRITPALSHGAILLAVASLSLLAGGHTHGVLTHVGARWNAAAYGYYCHLL